VVSSFRHHAVTQFASLRAGDLGETSCPTTVEGYAPNPGRSCCLVILSPGSQGVKESRGRWSYMLEVAGKLVLTCFPLPESTEAKEQHDHNIYGHTIFMNAGPMAVMLWHE
jgi:hypothetical protein